MSEVLDFLLDERRVPTAAHSLREQVKQGGVPERTVIRALLTVRSPAPLPPGISEALDELLRSQVSARGTVDAAALPSLDISPCVSLWQGDLTTLAADAIVNAANSRMLGCFIPDHACIDNAIHAVAGPALRAECDRHMVRQGFGEPTGTATITGGYNLPAKYVIHTVGPIIESGQPTAEEERLLASSYTSILDAAEAHGDIRTIGFCAISTGVFGYPKVDGARVALDTILSWLDSHPASNVHAVVSAYTAADFAIYLEAINERLSWATAATSSD